MLLSLIRHGETEHNRTHIHQPAEVPLTQRGREQLRLTAEALRTTGVTKLITSDLLRATQSADILADTLDIEAEHNVLFREVRRPSDVYGHRHIGFRSLWVASVMMWNIRRHGWHYSDEENMFDVANRVTEARAYLTELAKEHTHVAVVSHSFFMSIFMRYLCTNKPVGVFEYIRTVLALQKLFNGSISTLEFTPNGGWTCIKRNSRAHLST